MAERKPRSKSSYPPPSSIKLEREDFLKTFFRKGAKLTEELVKERESLRERIARLEEENTKLRAKAASDDAIRELLRTVEKLEREKEEVLKRYQEVEQRTTLREETLVEIEQELANLANLYVASYQLHTSLTPRGVVGHIRELLGQLVGAESFALYLVDETQKRLVPVTSEGLSEEEMDDLSVEAGLPGQAFRSAQPMLGAADPRQGTYDQPAACLPLRLDGTVIGVIVVYRTLEQKSEFIPTDHALFQLLGAQAMSALAAARLYTDRQGDVKLLAGFRSGREEPHG